MAPRSEPQPIDHSEALGADVVDQILLIPTADIVAGERLRAIDPVWASALGQLMRRDGQQTPIEVCRLPGQRQWTLVAGAHRHAGATGAGIAYLRAIVVSANRDDRRLREINENLWRRDLDPIDRAAFIAELVEIKRRQAGLAVTQHRNGSVDGRWKQALNDEAGETVDTMSTVYGWSDEVGEQLGLNGRTIRRDLYVYRRLAPSLIARLRDARHLVARNATQLRALAKLDPRAQGEVVDALIGANGWEPAKTVAEAIKRTQPAKSAVIDDDAKLKSRVISSLDRMTLAGRKAVLPDIVRQLTPGLRRLLRECLDVAFAQDEEGVRDDSQNEGGGASRLPGHGRSVRDGGLHAIGGHGADGAQGQSAFVDTVALAGSSGRAGGGAALDRLGAAHACATKLSGEGLDADFVIADVAKRYSGIARFANGTYELQVCGVAATCTAGGDNLLRAWLRKAAARLEQAA